jgi:hypothetical protein
MMMLGCFRKVEASDPKAFVAAVATVLAHYPEEVVRAVTDPASGLPSRLSWAPTIAEVKAACEERMAPLYRAQKRETVAQEARRLIAPPVDAPEIRERAVERWERLKGNIAGNPEDARLAAEAKLKELYGQPLPKLSPSALARLGVSENE